MLEPARWVANREIGIFIDPLPGGAHRSTHDLRRNRQLQGGLGWRFKRCGDFATGTDRSSGVSSLKLPPLADLGAEGRGVTEVGKNER